MKSTYLIDINTVEPPAIDAEIQTIVRDNPHDIYFHPQQDKAYIVGITAPYPYLDIECDSLAEAETLKKMLTQRGFVSQPLTTTYYHCVLHIPA